MAIVQAKVDRKEFTLSVQKAKNVKIKVAVLVQVLAQLLELVRALAVTMERAQLLLIPPRLICQ